LSDISFINEYFRRVRLRILHIINGLAKGGAERLAIDICRELDRRNEHDYLLVSLSPLNEYPELTSSLKLTVENAQIDLKLTGIKSAAISFQKLIRNFQPHVVHTHLFYADHAAHLEPLKGIAYFSHIHGPTSQYEQFKLSALFDKQKLVFALTRNHILKKYRGCNHHFIANSLETQTYLQRHLPFEKENIIRLDNAIDLKIFPFITRNFPSRELRLISTGSFVARKNHLFLLHLVKDLSEQDIPVHLTLLGDGPLRTSLRQQASSLGVTSQVAFAGNVDDVAAQLAKAHVYVHSATYEPFGLAIVEAMATGLPVICLDAKGNRGIVDEGISGFMIESADTKLFAERIKAIVKDEQTYHSFSISARRKAEQYDIANYVDNLVGIYLRNLSAR